MGFWKEIKGGHKASLYSAEAATILHQQTNFDLASHMGNKKHAEYALEIYKMTEDCCSEPTKETHILSYMISVCDLVAGTPYQTGIARAARFYYFSNLNSIDPLMLTGLKDTLERAGVGGDDEYF